MDIAERDRLIADMGKGLFSSNKALRVIAETLAYVRDQSVEEQIDLAGAIVMALSRAGHIR